MFATASCSVFPSGPMTKEPISKQEYQCDGNSTYDAPQNTFQVLELPG